MKKKLLIVSRNNLSAEFWKLQIRNKDINICKLQNPGLAILNIDTIRPDVVIVDNYFCTDDCDQWINETLTGILQTGFNCQVYCISSIYVFPENSEANKLQFVSYFPFNGEFLSILNSHFENLNSGSHFESQISSI